MKVWEDTLARGILARFAYNFLSKERNYRFASVEPSAAALVRAAFRFLNLAFTILQKENAHQMVCVFFLEVPARFELANESFADSCLTTWPRYHMK